MALQIRRGLDNDRKTRGFDQGEIIWSTDTEKLYVGRELGTLGGVNVLATSAGAGLKFDATTQTLAINPASLGFSTNDLNEGNNHQYFTPARAKLAAADMLQSGPHTGITFAYDAVTGLMTTQVTGTTRLSLDPAPTLGANMTLGGHNITGTGDISITGNITGTLLNGKLGSVMDLNGHGITGDGDIIINGTVSGTLSGNLTGSVFSSSNAVLVDSAASTLHGLLVTGQILPTSTTVKLGSELTPAAFSFYSNVAENAVAIHGPMGVNMEFYSSNGTLVAPTASVVNDNVGGVKFHGYSGTTFQTTAGIFARFDGNGTNTTDPDSTTLGTLGLAVGNGTGVTFAEFNSKGVFSAPIFKAASYATGSLPSSPQAGWMVFDSTTSQFKGWNGTSWVVLG